MMNGDKRNIALVIHVPQPAANPCKRQSAAMVLQNFRFNQFALKRTVFIARPHLQFIAGLLVDRNEPAPMPLHQTINTEHALRTVRQPANNSGPEMIVLIRRGFDFGKHPVALGRRANAFTSAHLNKHMGRLAGNALVPLHGLAIGLAVAVNTRNLDDSNRGQGGSMISFRRLFASFPDCSS